MKAGSATTAAASGAHVDLALTHLRVYWNVKGGVDAYHTYGCSRRGAKQDYKAGFVPMDTAGHGHRLHGDDREPAVWLDPVRQSHRGQIRLDQGCDSSCLHDFRVDGNVAGSHRGLFGRPLRSAACRVYRRAAMRSGLGVELLR